MNPSDLDSIISLSAIFSPYSFQVVRSDLGILVEFSHTSIHDRLLLTKKAQDAWAELLSLQSRIGRLILVVEGIYYPLISAEASAELPLRGS